MEEEPDPELPEPPETPPTPRPELRLRELPICFTERREGKSKMGLREIVGGASNLLKLRAELAVRSRPRPGVDSGRSSTR